jgi:hypothetical protein
LAGGEDERMNTPFRLTTDTPVSAAPGSAANAQEEGCGLLCTLARAVKETPAKLGGVHSGNPESVAIRLGAQSTSGNAFDLELAHGGRVITPSRYAVLFDAQGFGQLHLCAEVGDGI